MANASEGSSSRQFFAKTACEFNSAGYSDNCLIMAKKAKASDKEKAPSNGAALNGNAAKPAAKRASSPRKKPTTRKTPATKEGKSRVSDEAIRIRAYFISEQRERVGIPGDANSDWIEARRQLLTELGEN